MTAGRDGGAWTVQIADPIGFVGYYASLALDGSGNPHIGYLDLLNSDLKYVTRSGGIWMIEIGQPEPQLIAKDGYCPVWSEDGAAVYFTLLTEGRQGLWRYDLQQKKERRVYSWERVFNFDLAGSRLVFTQHKNESQIYSISLDQ